MARPCASLCRLTTSDSENGTQRDLLDPAGFAVLHSTQGRLRRQADAQALRQEAVRRFGMQPCHTHGPRLGGLLPPGLPLHPHQTRPGRLRVRHAEGQRESLLGRKRSGVVLRGAGGSARSFPQERRGGDPDADAGHGGGGDGQMGLLLLMSETGVRAHSEVILHTEIRIYNIHNAC